MKRKQQRFNIGRATRGQTLVELGLVFLIVVLSSAALFKAQGASETAIRAALVGGGSNPNKIMTPAAVTPETAWNKEPNLQGNGVKMKPTAFFTMQNPVYVGTKVSYYDGSYDPDGVIVSRTWVGNQTVFNTPGKYSVSLTVVDNDDHQDTYKFTFEVVERESYKRIVADHSKEVRNISSESSVYNVGSASGKIIDHKFGTSIDKYNVSHLYISENYRQTTQQKAKRITYDVQVPLYEVTYNSAGQEVSREPYMIDEELQYNTYEEVKEVPQPAKIDVVWEPNTWTYYIADSVSGVKNYEGANANRGVYNYSNDYSRFAPEVKTTRQDPAFVSSRDSKKDAGYATGSSVPSVVAQGCPSCTVPNRFVAQAQDQSQSDTLYGCQTSESRTTYTRTYNYVDHSSVDKYYQYKGTKTTVSNNGTLEEKTRNSWRTEGWSSSEMVGEGTAQSSRSKYTNCTGSGESCWQPVSNTITNKTDYDPIYKAGSTYYDSREYNVTSCYPDPKTGKPTKQCYTKDLYQSYTGRFKDWTCTFSGNTRLSENYTWTTYAAPPVFLRPVNFTRSL